MRIKFRGIDWETGEYVYGDLIQGNYDEVCPRIKPRKKKARYVKDVAQLVGTDKNGNEIYEGDIIQANHNGVHYEYKARLAPCAVADNGCCLWAKQLSTHELKELTT